MLVVLLSCTHICRHVCYTDVLLCFHTFDKSLVNTLTRTCTPLVEIDLQNLAFPFTNATLHAICCHRFIATLRAYHGPGRPAGPYLLRDYHDYYCQHYYDDYCDYTSSTTTSTTTTTAATTITCFHLITATSIIFTAGCYHFCYSR